MLLLVALVAAVSGVVVGALAMCGRKGDGKATAPQLVESSSRKSSAAPSDALTVESRQVQQVLDSMLSADAEKREIYKAQMEQVPSEKLAAILRDLYVAPDQSEEIQLLILDVLESLLTEVIVKAWTDDQQLTFALSLITSIYSRPDEYTNPIASTTLGHTFKGMTFREETLAALACYGNHEIEGVWTTQDYEIEPSRLGNEVLFDNSLVCCLRKKSTFEKIDGEIVLRATKPLLSNGEWKWREDGIHLLGALSFLCDGATCSSKVIPLITPLLKDSNMRVRDEAIRAMKKFTSVDCRGLKDSAFAQVFPALTNALVDPISRVAARAADAIAAYVLRYPRFDGRLPNKVVIHPQADAMMQRLVEVLSNGWEKLFKEDKLMCIAMLCKAIAAVGRAFPTVNVKHYERLIIPMKSIFMETRKTNEDDRCVLLAVNAAACVARLGEAIGKEKAAEFRVHLLVIISNLASNIPFFEALLNNKSFGTDFCVFVKILGGQFAPFLPQFVPALIKHASKHEGKCPCSGYKHSIDRCRPEVFLILHICAKCTAGLRPYFESLRELTARERSAHGFLWDSWAYTIMTHLIACRLAHGETSAAMFMFEQYWPELVQAFSIRCYVDRVLSEVGQAIDIVGPKVLTKSRLEQVERMIGKTMENFVEADEEREQVDLLVGASELIYKVYKTSRQHVGRGYHEKIGSSLLDFLSSESFEIKWAACHAMGRLSLSKVPDFAEIAIAALPSLTSLVMDTIAAPEDEEKSGVYENALTALSLIVQAYGDRLGAGEAKAIEKEAVESALLTEAEKKTMEEIVEERQK